MQKKKVNNHHRKRSRTWPWIVCGVVISLLTSIVWLFFSQSEAYQQEEIDNSDQISAYLTHHLVEEMYNRSQLGTAFDLEIDQFKLNKALAQFEWPQQWGDILFSDPMVVFSDEVIYVMGRLEYKEMATIITITLSPTFSEDQKLCLNIESIRLGQLPAKFIVMVVAQRMVETYRQSLHESGVNVEVVEAIINNGHFEPLLYLFDNPLKVKGLSSKPGTLIATLEPVLE